MLCELCRCEEASTFHHLIPRTVHGNKWFKKRFTREQMRSGIDVCAECQKTVHKLIDDEKQMGRHYNTLEKLLTHPGVARYVEWKTKKGVKKQLP
ncbi:MAG: hypothetical protein ACYTG0_22170 [Planctomycetota bacterium]|jgi:hypothetical protein